MGLIHFVAFDTEVYHYYPDRVQNMFVCLFVCCCCLFYIKTALSFPLFFFLFSISKFRSAKIVKIRSHNRGWRP